METKLNSEEKPQRWQKTFFFLSRSLFNFTFRLLFECRIRDFNSETFNLIEKTKQQNFLALEWIFEIYLIFSFFVRHVKHLKVWSAVMSNLHRFAALNRFEISYHMETGMKLLVCCVKNWIFPHHPKALTNTIAWKKTVAEIFTSVAIVGVILLYILFIHWKKALFWRAL